MDAERRQVTVLFADMVGFTTFSERSGEEAAFTLMRTLENLMDDAVREQGANRGYLDHTATVVEPFWIDHLFLPLGTTM